MNNVKTTWIGRYTTYNFQSFNTLQIDNIAVNVGRAEMDVEAGKGHLDKARTLRASARKKKIILGIVLAIVILIVILVVLDAVNLI